MAPEVFEEKYSSKADIWAVGCVALQMATGSPPWKNTNISNPVALFNHMKRTEGLPEVDFLAPESDLARKLLDTFKQLVSQCFPREPKLRPDARSLLSHPFFTDALHWSDGEEACDLSMLFSPSPTTSKNVVKSPLGARVSPMSSLRRINSAGSLRSPFMSPLLPKRSGGFFMRSPLPLSPKPNSIDWPTWARSKLKAKEEANSPTAGIATTLNGLAIGEDFRPMGRLDGKDKAAGVTKTMGNGMSAEYHQVAREEGKASTSIGDGEWKDSLTMSEDSCHSSIGTGSVHNSMQRRLDNVFTTPSPLLGLQFLSKS
jgi:serine/threonine protein kinase